MTWIRCSDRMPMGEACEARLGLPRGEEWIETFPSATVETLRRTFGTAPKWIDRTEWRAVEEPEETCLWIDRAEYDRDPGSVYSLAFDEGEDVTVHENGEVHFFIGAPKAAKESETLRDVLELDGIKMRWFKLMEEMGELAAELGRWFGPGFKPGSGHQDRIAEEAADVSIVLDSIMTDPGWGEAIRAARARKLARLRERMR
jgi:hypothetical protein